MASVHRPSYMSYSSTSRDTGAVQDAFSPQQAPCKVLLDYVVPDKADGNLSADTVSRPSVGQSDQVILDHKGPVRLQLHPDGSFTCDPCTPPKDATLPAQPPAAPANPPTPPQKGLVSEALWMGSKVLHMMGVLSFSAGAAAGWMVIVTQAEHSTPMQLFMAVSETTSCTIAGMLTGFLMGPLIAVNALLKSVARPALLGGLFHGGRMLLSNLGGTRRLVRKLQSGDVLGQLDAVQKIAQKAAKSDRFRQAFHRHGGMESLLRLLAGNPQGGAASLIAAALAQLVPNPDCKDAVVSCCGVGLVAQLLDHSDPLTVALAAQALSHLSSHTLAQDSLRDQAVVPKLVALLQADGSLPYDTPQHCVQALQHLAGDPANRSAMVSAGAVPILARLLRDVSVLSEVKAVAVALLHMLARSNPDVAQALADMEDLAAILQRLLAALGPLWHPAKADIHALLNTLSRTPPTMLGGDVPVLVCPPARLSPEVPAAAAAVATGGRRSVMTTTAIATVVSGSDEEDVLVEGSGIVGMDYVTLAA